VKIPLLLQTGMLVQLKLVKNCMIGGQVGIAGHLTIGTMFEFKRNQELEET
jgi:UDP-3-O-[3-hydroxymyristoyl] glucosamine N-acyltransferase